MTKYDDIQQKSGLMTLSELLGGDDRKLTVEEEQFLQQAKHVWAKQFNAIVRESKVLKKGHRHGRF